MSEENRDDGNNIDLMHAEGKETTYFSFAKPIKNLCQANLYSDDDPLFGLLLSCPSPARQTTAIANKSDCGDQRPDDQERMCSLIRREEWKDKHKRTNGVLKEHGLNLRSKNPRCNKKPVHR